MNERLEKLRKSMAERKIDAYVVPTSDFHESEYVGEYFKCRKFLTGFTGSAGTAVVTASEAYLWTDGRYFVQAQKELTGSGFSLQKMGQEHVPDIEEYLEQVLPQGGVLGFDGRVMNAQMVEAKATLHILTTVDDIAWLLNIRGNDVPCNPVVLSYAVITRNEFYLFIHEKTLDQKVKEYLEALSVTIKPYDSIYEFVKSYRGERALLEKGKVNYAIVGSLEQGNKILDRMNPTAVAKAVKNPTEIENERKAHIKDGVAMTKFLYWLKKQIGTMPMTEISVSDYLETLRREQEGNLGLSFTTISAYKENAAMCHYCATLESNKELKPEGLYLVDSGGQYYEGTTDITRTVALGPVTKEEREHFTLVAMSMLRLGHVKFPYGCRGLSLDYAARELFWSRGMNYDHGTGHGVGYLLNVHERPNGIRWKMVPERMDSGILEEGMICSDEPGIYIEGSHGIRTENMMVCKKAEKNLYGQFMEFEFLTFVPIDLDALDVSLMEDRDIAWLNEYHRQVYEKISPHLNEEEANWLKYATREISAGQ